MRTLCVVLVLLNSQLIAMGYWYSNQTTNQAIQLLIVGVLIATTLLVFRVVNGAFNTLYPNQQPSVDSAPPDTCV